MVDGLTRAAVGRRTQVLAQPSPKKIQMSPSICQKIWTRPIPIFVSRYSEKYLQCTTKYFHILKYHLHERDIPAKARMKPESLHRGFWMEKKQVWMPWYSVSGDQHCLHHRRHQHQYYRHFCRPPSHQCHHQNWLVLDTWWQWLRPLVPRRALQKNPHFQKYHCHHQHHHHDHHLQGSMTGGWGGWWGLLSFNAPATHCYEPVQSDWRRWL